MKNSSKQAPKESATTALAPQTIQEIDRALHKIIAKYPTEHDPVLTDIHLEVRQETGDFLAYDDDDREINRCVVAEWMGNQAEDFYQQVSVALNQRLSALRPELDKMSVLRPFSFVLVDGDHETLSDIYLVDDDQEILSGSLLPNLEDELDSFMKSLFNE